MPHFVYRNIGEITMIITDLLITYKIGYNSANFVQHRHVNKWHTAVQL